MLIWKNTDGSTSVARPWRVRLPDRTTRTHTDITDEQLAAAGWSQEEVADIQAIETATEGNVSVVADTTGTEP